MTDTIHNLGLQSEIKGFVVSPKYIVGGIPWNTKLSFLVLYFLFQYCIFLPLLGWIWVSGVRLVFEFFIKKHFKNQTGLSEDRHASVDSLIESTISIKTCIPYLIMIHKMCLTLLILCIIMGYDRSKYGLITIRIIIAYFFYSFRFSLLDFVSR